MKKSSSEHSPAKGIDTSSVTLMKHLIHNPIVHISLIVILGLLAYSNTFNSPFQYDDFSNIAYNPAIKDFQYFSDPLRMELIDKSNGLNKPSLETRYIGYLTFALNYRLHGLDVTGYHLVNIFIHIFNSLLLYWFMTHTFRTPYFSVIDRENTFSNDTSRKFIAVFTALFFAVHPLHTESVTYIVQRFTSLATFFYLMSLVMYIKWREDKEQQSKRYAPHAMLYAISLLSAVLAMKTKEIAFTLPICILVYEFMFFKGKPIKRALYLIPLLLTMLIIPMTLLSLNAPLGDIIGDVSEVTRDHPDISRPSYLFTQFRVIVTYIRLLVFPIDQNLDYDYPVYNSLLDPAVFLSFIFLLVVFGLGVYLYRISRITHYTLHITAFGIFWFFITLSVESSVIPIKDIIFEHRLYLPSVGFFMALTGAIWAGMEKLGEKAEYAKRAVLYVMITMILILSGAAYSRNAVWKESIRLWENAVEGSPRKARPHFNLGFAYTDQGRIDEAINEYQITLELNPDYPMAYQMLNVLSKK